jgi:nicotinamidase-related amidase
MQIHREDTALVFIDPQNEVLSETGKAWPLVRESLRENQTIENMERLFQAAKAQDFEVFISPHYFYPTDQGWKFNGPLETEEANSGMFARKGVRPGQSGGYAAFLSGATFIAGYHRERVERQSPFNTWVRIWSKRWAPRSLQRICCFFTNRLLTT